MVDDDEGPTFTDPDWPPRNDRQLLESWKLDHLPFFWPGEFEMLTEAPDCIINRLNGGA